jgi:hypothetical protein
MARKNTTPVADATPVTIESLIAERDAITETLAGLRTSWTENQARRKEVSAMISEMRGSITADRNAARIEKTNARIEALQAQLANLSGANA